MSEVETETPAETEEPAEDPIEETPAEEEQPEEEIEFQAEPPIEAQGRSPEDLEKIRKKLDTSANTWRRRVEEVLGDDFAALTVCELCDGWEGAIPGFHWPAEMQPAMNETHGRLLETLKSGQTPEYVPSTQVRSCDQCAGWGKVRSGSKLAAHELITCVACKGYGYVPPPVPSDNGYAAAAQVEPGNIGSDDLEPPSDADIWGSPRLLPDGQENPNYGKMPQYKIPSLP